MTESSPKEMFLVYDVRNDASFKRSILPHLEQQQWQSFLRGEMAIEITEARIKYVYDDPIGGTPLFELEGSFHRYDRKGDDSRYVVGRLAKIERVAFQYPIDGGNFVVKIWIANDDSNKIRAY
jgi:hypothetical protein